MMGEGSRLPEQGMKLEKKLSAILDKSREEVRGRFHGDGCEGVKLRGIALSPLKL